MKGRQFSEGWTESDEKLHAAVRQITGSQPNFWGDGEPKTDYSFLDESFRQKRQIWYPLSRVAAILIIILAASGGIAVWISSEPASAFRFEIGKKFFEIKGKIFSAEDQNDVVNDNSISYEFDTMKDIDKAKKALPELLVPDYIPEGFKLESLRIEKDIEIDNFIVNYKFKKNDGDILIITMQRLEGDHASDEAIGETEKLELEDRVIYSWGDSVMEKNSVAVFYRDMAAFLSGDAEKEEMIRVGESLK